MTLAGTRDAPALRLRPRGLAAVVLVTLVGVGAFVWPLVLGFGRESGSAHSVDAPWVFLVLVPLLLLVVAAEIADGTIDAKGVALLGVLGGTCAALRPVTGGVTGVQLMFFLLVPAGRVLGPGFGFVLGNVAMFASAAITGGGGPWLPFQMLAAGWIGLFAGLLPRCRGKVELALLAGYGFVASVLYGFVLDLWFWPFGTTGNALGSAVTFLPGAPLAENLQRWIVFSVTTGLGFDLPRAVTTAVAVLLFGRPVLAALRRASRRAAFGASATFVASDPADSPTVRA